MTDAHVISPAVIASLRALGDDHTFLDEVIDLFVDDAGPRVSRLRTALAAGDRTAAVAAAHSIKGGAGNIGAAIVAREAEALEERLRAGEVIDPVSGADRLAAELDRAVAALNALRSQPRGLP